MKQSLNYYPSELDSKQHFMSVLFFLTDVALMSVLDIIFNQIILGFVEEIINRFCTFLLRLIGYFD